jgi:hypothetical protein
MLASIWIAMKLIPSWAYGALAIVALGVGIEFHGRAHVQHLWDADRQEIARISQTAIAAANVRNSAILAQQTADAEVRIKGYQDEAIKAHADAANSKHLWLRLSKASCDNFASSTDPKSSQGSDATTAGTVPLPDTIEQSLRALMLEADLVVASCRAAQGFIRDNGMYP